MVNYPKSFTTDPGGIPRPCPSDDFTSEIEIEKASMIKQLHGFNRYHDWARTKGYAQPPPFMEVTIPHLDDKCTQMRAKMVDFAKALKANEWSIELSKRPVTPGYKYCSYYIQAWPSTEDTRFKYEHNCTPTENPDNVD